VEDPWQSVPELDGGGPDAPREHRLPYPVVALLLTISIPLLLFLPIILIVLIVFAAGMSW
jgi:hypothetical protein